MKKEIAFTQFTSAVFFGINIILLCSTNTQADPLSLDQALKEAQGGSLEIQVSDARRESSDWGSVEARAAFLPQLNLDATHFFSIKYQTLDLQFGGALTTFPFVTPATTYALNASWNIFNSFQDFDRLGAANLAKEASHRDLDWSRFQVEQEVRLNFYESLAARLLESVAEENVANLEQHLQQIQDMLKAGEAIEVDVLRVQVQLNTARSQKINAEDEVIISQQHLAQALGKMTETRTPSGNLPIPDGSISNRIETMSKEEKDRFEGRADLQATDLRTEAAERSESAASHYWIPSIAIVGDYQFYNNTNFDVASSTPFKSAYQYGLELKWTIFDGLLSYARSKEAAAESIRQVKSASLARIQAATDVQTNLSDYHFQLSQFMTNTENLERSKRSVQLALSGLRSGTQTNTDVLDAELDLFNARAGVIQSEIKALEAQIKFENAIGRKI